MITANCNTCGTLIYAQDIPTKSTGNCWRCEVKRLRAALQNIAETCIDDPDTAQFACRVLNGSATIKRVK